SEAAVARKLGIARQGLHEALHGTTRGIRLAHLDNFAECEGMTAEQVLRELLGLARKK
ncbi:MAG: hypothetical protein JWO36_6216, partial [Myxococcales bacterium]|nr:hypothetical protein [Myxococcales bacterium]